MYPNFPSYYSIEPEDLGKNGKIKLLKLNDFGEVYSEYAMQMLSEVEKNNAIGKNTVFICPCGPVGQYPVLARWVNERRTSLKNTWFINMDELLTDDEEWIPLDDPQSFHRFMNKNLYDLLDPELAPAPDHRVFPDPHDPGAIARLIKELGGVDIVMGGIALNGHIAFNEPQPELSVEEFAELPTRVVKLSAATTIKNAILDRGGAYDTLPAKAITVGMKEMLSARRILVSMTCDMQRSTIRHALYGDVSADFPITLVQNHPNAEVMITANVLPKPF